MKQPPSESEPSESVSTPRGGLVMEGLSPNGCHSSFGLRSAHGRRVSEGELVSTYLSSSLDVLVYSTNLGVLESCEDSYRLGEV